MLLENGKIYTVTQGIIEKGSILIKDGKISEVGKDLKKPEGVEVIDLEGMNVMPGFIDAHSHLGMKEDGIGFEGIDHNERVNPITPGLRVVDGINPMDRTLKEAYEAGVTTAHVCPGSANIVGGSTAIIKTYGHRIDHMVVKAPAAMKIAFGENPKRVYNGQKKSPTTRMAIAGKLRELLLKSKEYMEKKEAGLEVDFNLDYEGMIPVLKREIPLKAHAHRADDIFTAIRIAKEFNIKLTLDHCTDGSLIKEDLAREEYPAIVGPTLGHRSKFEVKNKSFETPKDLIEEGVLTAITTDSPVIPLHHLPLCAGLAHGAGLSEEDALKSITINPAIISGIEDRVGSIEKGKDADLVIVEGNPIKDLNHKVIMTIIDGKIVYKN